MSAKCHVINELKDGELTVSAKNQHYTKPTSDRHTGSRLTTSFPGQPGEAGIRKRKVKPILILSAGPYANQLLLAPDR